MSSKIKFKSIKDGEEFVHKGCLYKKLNGLSASIPGSRRADRFEEDEEVALVKSKAVAPPINSVKPKEQE